MQRESIRSGMSIGQRITASFMLMIMLVLVASVSGLFFDRSVSQSISTANDAINNLNAVADLEIAWFQVVANTDYMLLTRQNNLIEGRLGEQVAQFNTDLAIVQSQVYGASMDTLASLAQDLNNTVTILFEQANDGTWTRAQATRFTELSALQRRFSDTLTMLQDEIHISVDASLAQSQELQTSTRQGWVVLSLVAVVLGALASFLTARSIIRPVNSLGRAAQAIQQGDFTRRVEITSKDELGVLGIAFNSMTEQVSKSITTLEHNVAELEATNTERNRLIHELKEALLFKDQFLATMSHELRTPLNAILGYSALILDEELDEDVRYMMDRIEGNSTRLLGLINDVLNIARINANRVEILARPVDLNAMVQGWYNDFKTQADQKGLEFQLEIDPTLPQTIIGDEERLTQITANLLHNALKFTIEGFIALRVTRDPNSPRWSIVVADSGQGIPETWQHLIFDEFRQVDSGSKRKHGGAGLGLSIVKKLCLLMGGSVVVNSKLEVGSTFIVTLPLQTEAASKPVTELKVEKQVEEEIQHVANVAAS